ncbi:MAG TPA: STAS/SEC14 domain-containing protein [Polyangia bacterium]
MRCYSIDESRYPLVVVTAQGEIPLDDFQQYLVDIERVIRRGRQAHVLDFREARVPSAEVRRGKAEWFKQHERLMKEHVAGTAVVFHSPLFRFMLSSIMLIVPIPVPFSTHGVLEEGVAWAERQLDRRWGIKVAG